MNAMNYQQLWRQLLYIYDEGEAKAIARLVFEVRFGLTMSDVLMGRDTDVPQAELQQIATRLLDNEPVQYVLGQTDFYGRTYHVEPGVLIPRPETEELCRLIIEDDRTRQRSQPTDTTPIRQVLDIGTGSGCIAITLATELPQVAVSAWDISPIALRVATENARQLGVSVSFKEHDMLTQHYCVAPQWHLIVSNPPYICDSEADAMSANVLDYEPEIALFVPDDDPLRFYGPIMNYAQSALYSGGMLWLETNPLYEEWIEERLLELGFEDVQGIDDLFGKTRFIKAIR